MSRTKFSTAMGVIALAAMLHGAIIGTTRADTTTFNFESETATAIPVTGVRTGALSALSITVSGLTLQVTRPGGKFDIVQNTGPQAKPASWGSKSLDPFVQQTQATPFVINFSIVVTNVSVVMGDYGDDPGDVLVLKAFSGLDASGSTLASTSGTLPLGDSTFDFRTLSVAANGIRSISLIGGSTFFPQSVFYDNITVSFDGSLITGGGGPIIPEPSSLALVGAGLLSLLALRRRKSRL